nr:hypothetical protein [Tanacetum cinerariifolium]
TEFSQDGLSAIASKLGTRLMLDSYTSGMCMQSCGRSSYARAMIELRANVELKDTIVVAMPKLVMGSIDALYVLSMSGNLPSVRVVREVATGVQVGPKVGFKPTKQFYKLVSNKSSVSSSSKKKQAEVSRPEVSNSNPSDALNSVENDDDLDDDGKLLPKVVSTVNANSDSEVEEVFNETACYMASTNLKSGSESGYDTKSLLEQWKKTKQDDDYDPYDDNFYESYDMSENL